MTVIAPVSEPRHGYVVFDDTRRASAGRRLEKTLGLLRSSGIRCAGLRRRDRARAGGEGRARRSSSRAPDEIIVSTHPEQRSGWLRRDVVDEITRAAGGVPVRHVVAGEDDAVELEKNVLVVANETVISQGAPRPHPRARRRRGPRAS